VLDRVPLLVIPCQLERLTEPADGFRLSNFYGSIFPAVWSFMLALRARGLGSTLTTLHLMHEDEVARLLDIPATVSQITLLPVAYFLGEDFRPVERPPASRITYWNRWTSGSR
jgi:nitroreductase